MKIRILPVLTCFLMLFAGCGGKEEPAAVAAEPVPAAAAESDFGIEGDFVEIGEKVFISLINDIYLNAQDYLGKTIKYEGIYKTEVWEMLENTETIHYVIRYGPGCCGSDGDAGFEIVWDGDMPEQNDWVEVVGTLEELEIDGYSYLQLDLDSITVLDERGAEFVMQ